MLGHVIQSLKIEAKFSDKRIAAHRLPLKSN